MSLVRKVIYRVIMLLFIVLFVVIFVGTVFDNRSLIYAENPLVMLLMFTITTIFFVVVYKLIFKKIDDDISIKKELAIAGALMIVFVILQGIFLYNRATYPSWDWKDVLYGARDYVMGRTDLIDWTYFQNYPNNSAMLHIEVILFKILNFFGLLTEKSAIVSTMIVNWVIIDCSALLIYLTVRSLFNKRMALFSIVICIFSYAFYSYLPTFYTDTVTMIFPILIIYLYVKFIKNKNSWYLVWGGLYL